MSFQIVSVSPKGQITIPVSERANCKSKKYGLKVMGGTIILRPIEIKFADDDLKDFAKLAEKSFSFWDNEDDDIYEEFYKKQK